MTNLQQPRVSVVVPFFNRIPWLVDAIDSVLRQSERDFEIILVNDGSTEAFDPETRCHDPRIRYTSQRNRGPGSARNAGIAVARGRLVAFLDADDLFEPRKLETQVEYMERHPDVVLSHTSYVKVRDDCVRLETVDSGAFAGSVYPAIILNCPIATPTVMVRRDALARVRFEEDLRAGEDTMLWIRLSRMGRVGGIRQPLTLVRVHGSNAGQNPETFAEANSRVLADAFARDSSLGGRFQARALSSLSASVASLHAARGEVLEALRWYSRAWKQQPTNATTYIRFMFEFLLPRRLQRLLRGRTRFDGREEGLS